MRKPFFSAWGEKLKRAGAWTAEHTWRPLLQSDSEAFPVEKAPPPKGPEPPAEPSPSEWKEKMLAEFREWLDEMPSEPMEAENLSPDTCDLYTLLSEFTSLRQEIRMQNREQSRTVRSLDQCAEACKTTGNRLETLAEIHREFHDLTTRSLQHREDETARMERITGELNRFMETLKPEIEKQTLLPFLDLRDALFRGIDACREVSVSRGLFRQAPKGMDGVIEGYEMAIRRFDRALESAGIRPLETTGLPFSPETMRAVGKKTGGEKGVVAETQRGGFVRGNAVIRTAEVVVFE